MRSPTTTSSRSGSQRRKRHSIWWAQSVTVLWRRPRVSWYRSDGARTVRKGRAHTRRAQETSASSVRLTQRSPLALTKWPWDERTGSRSPPRASIFSPQRRSRVSSMANRSGPVGTRWLDQLVQQHPADRQGRLGGPAEDMVEQGEVAPPLKPSTYRAVDTVRRPGPE